MDTPRARRRSTKAHPSYSYQTSFVSSEPSLFGFITPSQPNSPAASASPTRFTFDKATVPSPSYIEDIMLASIISLDDTTESPKKRQCSLNAETWSPVSLTFAKSPESPVVDDSSPSVPPPLIGRNSLEVEMDVNPRDQEGLLQAIKLLSSSHSSHASSGRSQFPTWRASTIKNLEFPEPITRALYALVTNTFTPAQLSAARRIQQFLRSHPNRSIPTFLITDEIAEINGEHGWCLIGKCGLERVSYKISRSTSTSVAAADRQEEDQPRIQIQALCDHVRDSHFQQMPFPCHLCPASFSGQCGLDRHLRTHPLGDFECTACGEILYSSELRHRHQHSKHAKSSIGDKFIRLLTKVVPLK